MNRFVGISVIAVALALGIAAPASANLVTVTYTGTITDDTSYSYAITTAFTWQPVYSYDYSNQYVGQTASITFTYDPSQLTPSSYSDLPYVSNTQLSGASGSATGSSPYGSVSVGSSSGFDAQVGSSPLDGYTFVSTSTNAQNYDFSGGDSYSYNSSGAYAQVDSFAQYPFSLTSSANYVLNPVIGDYGSGSFSTNVGWTDQYTGEGAETVQQVDFAINRVTVSGVPEPATWAMMIIGFAGVGFAGMRARRREAAAA